MSDLPTRNPSRDELFDYGHQYAIAEEEKRKRRKPKEIPKIVTKEDIDALDKQIEAMQKFMPKSIKKRRAGENPR